MDTGALTQCDAIIHLTVVGALLCCSPVSRRLQVFDTLFSITRCRRQGMYVNIRKHISPRWLVTASTPCSEAQATHPCQCGRASRGVASVVGEGARIEQGCRSGGGADCANFYGRVELLGSRRSEGGAGSSNRSEDGSRGGGGGRRRWGCNVIR